jgi:hypothetical protein
VLRDPRTYSLLRLEHRHSNIPVSPDLLCEFEHEPFFSNRFLILFLLVSYFSVLRYQRWLWIVVSKMSTAKTEERGAPFL